MRARKILLPTRARSLYICASTAKLQISIDNGHVFFLLIENTRDEDIG